MKKYFYLSMITCLVIACVDHKDIRGYWHTEDNKTTIRFNDSIFFDPMDTLTPYYHYLIRNDTIYSRVYSETSVAYVIKYFNKDTLIVESPKGRIRLIRDKK